MADTMNYYEYLAISPKAGPGEVLRASRRMARTTHPDAGGSAEAFRITQQVADTLRNPQARAGYDLMMANGMAPTVTIPKREPSPMAARLQTKVRSTYFPSQVTDPIFEFAL